MAENLFGRRQIFSSASAITASNVVEVLKDALLVHLMNRMEIDYLYNYYKGKQPILNRTKRIRSDIVHKIVVNRALEIVSFKTGYLVGEPIQYVGRNLKSADSDRLSELNTYLLTESKASKDKSLEEWREIAGTSYRMAVPNTDLDADAPFHVYTLDPRQTFVIYNSGVAHEPLAGVYFVLDDDDYPIYCIYTPNEYIEVKNDVIVKRAVNGIGMIPIIEYPANNARLGAFEPVLPLLDEINDIESNRADAVSQFVQSICLAINLDLPEGTTSTDISETGILAFNSVDGNKSEFKILSEQMDQLQTQTLIEDKYNSILRIVGMPSQADGGTSDSSNNGAVILKNGWESAEARAKDSENDFRVSEMAFLKLIINICNKSDRRFKLKARDVAIKFTRRNYQDILSKANVLSIMLANELIAPIDAYVACGMFPDPDDACERGLAWRDENRASQEAEQEEVVDDGTSAAV